MRTWVACSATKSCHHSLGEVQMRNAKMNQVLRPAPLAIALAAALAAPVAIAAPTATQMPGAGAVSAVVGAGTVGVNGGAAGASVTGLKSGDTLDVTGRAVITWGGAGAPADAANPAGFNIGQNATLKVDGAAAGAALLNIDASGNASQIYGTLNALGATNNLPVFVANANGVVVSGTAKIIAPAGVGLIGANLNNATAIGEFIDNGNLDVTGTLAPVRIEAGATVSGSDTVNAPAAYTLVVGSNVTNAGNIFANQTNVVAGLTASSTKVGGAVVPVATTNLKADTVVYPLADINGALFAGANGTDATKNSFLVSSGSGSFVNTGSISSSVGGTIQVDAAAGVRTGTDGDGALVTGIFTDGDVNLNSYLAGSKVELYNVVRGYGANPNLSSLTINGAPGANVSNVVINTLKPTTDAEGNIVSNGVGGITVNGNSITVKSSLVSGLSTAAGTESDITLDGNTIAVSADLLSRRDVFVTANGPLSISGNVTADTNKGGTGNIKILNNGKSSGNTSTISGTLSTGSAGGSISVANNGAFDSFLDLSGDVLAHTTVTVASNGNLRLGTVTSGANTSITALGLGAELTGAITAGSVGSANSITYAAKNATTLDHAAAKLSADTVNLTVLNFKADANNPVDQIKTQTLNVVAYGSVNAPITGNTDWLQNAVNVSSANDTAPLNISISAIGAGFQAINVKGNAANVLLNSGATTTPYAQVLTTGTVASGGLQGNLGSQFIFNGTGNVDTSAGNFNFPGGLVLKADGVLTVGNVINAFTLTPQAYQGIFFEAPQIAALGYVATNTGSWVNFSTMPLAGIPTIYTVTQASPTTFNFTPVPSAAKKNSYSALITGTAPDGTQLSN